MGVGGMGGGGGGGRVLSLSENTGPSTSLCISVQKLIHENTRYDT